MSTEDLSESLAAELTGSLGVPDDATTDDVLPNDLADAVEEQERHLAERDIAVNNDVDDTREAAEQREAEQAQKPGRGQKVPLAALHEERTKRQQAEEALRAQALQLQQLQAQWQAQQQAQLQAQQEAAIPEFSTDPEGHIEAVKAQFKQELENLKGGPAQQPQIHQVEQLQALVHQEMAMLAPSVLEVEQRFIQQHPDYSDAFAHMQAIVDTQLRARHPNASEAEIQLAHQAELVGHLRNCQARNLDPCEVVYTAAQKLGFKPANRAPKPHHTSLSDAHGSTHAPDERSSLHASDIAEMSEAEFDKYWNDMKRSSTVRPAF
ncbi:hypothetical protein [Pseudomonas sp. G(2018)]|uniref:hypothetical protein n=1 Tax=Pseudomonas sp. G(2018) TaxID=2502242 RepID=UPI0010F91212|nr:hypothetical protein [Pseudomonas sp. G(2018)]